MCNQKEPVDVVYKFVPCDRFYGQMDEYLAGNLYFADWHKFDDKREGKYMCSSTVPKDLRNELKDEKYRYKVCSTTIKADIFELWDRCLANPPAICLVVKIKGLNTKDKEKQGLYEFTEQHIDYVQQLNYEKLKKLDPDKKAIQILNTKRNRYYYEQEYRLMKNIEKAGMHYAGEVIGVIVGGCCPKEDSCFIKLRHAVLDKSLCFKRAYIDFPQESVSIQDDYCCFGNQT